MWQFSTKLPGIKGYETAMKDKKKCEFKGTINEIPPCILGSSKQINCKIKATKNGIVGAPEDLKSLTWQIGRKDLQLIKDYQISVREGKVQALSEEELKKNPLVFKCWKSSASEEPVECRGECGHGQFTAVGTMQIKGIRAIFTGIVLRRPLIGGITLGERQFWHLTLRLQGQVKLESQFPANGTVGLLNLVNVKRTADSVTILDSNGKFILHTYDRDAQTPILDIEKVTNGLFKNSNSNLYQLDFPLNQVLEPANKHYNFDDIIHTYFFFKSQEADSIWHPIGNQGTTDSPFCIQWICKVQISYEGDHWKFDSYKEAAPEFLEVTELPSWEQNIWRNK